MSTGIAATGIAGTEAAATEAAGTEAAGTGVAGTGVAGHPAAGRAQGGGAARVRLRAGRDRGDGNAAAGQQGPRVERVAAIVPAAGQHDRPGAVHMPRV